MQNHGWIEATHPQTPRYPCPNKHRHSPSLSENSSSLSQRSHPMPLDHETWARSQGFQVREVESGFRYTPDSCFDTYPFLWRPGSEPSDANSPVVRAIADAARETRPPPRRLAQPAQSLRRRPQDPHPHQALQRPPRVARQRPPHPRRSRLRRLRLVAQSNRPGNPRPAPRPQPRARRTSNPIRACRSQA